MATSPRRSSRSQSTEIFKNIYGVESAADSPPVVVKFQRHLAETIDFNNGMETGHLKYAPSLRNPYYMCLHVTQFAELLVNTPYGPEWATPARYHRTTAGVAFQSYFNISLKLFRDIANDEVDWLALSCLEDPQVVDLSDEETEAEAVVLKEMAFTGLLDPPIIDPVDRKRYDEPVPGMEVEGEAIKLSKFVRQDPYPSTSIDYEKTIWKISREIAKKKSRRAYIPVRHPQGWLMWLRLRNWNKDRQKRRGQLKNMKEVFKKLWMHLTATDPESAAGYRPRYSSAELGFPLYFVPAPDLLTLRLGWGAQQRDALFEGLVEAIRKTHPNTELVVTNSTQVTGTGFVKMGENPFGLFATYVSANAFDIYMKGLEALNGYTGQSLSRQDAHRLQLKTDTELESWIGIHYHPKDKEYTTPQDTARESVRKWQTQAESPYSKEKPCGSTWCIGVGSAKIKDAFGKRIAKYSPKEIMGMSANEAAEHAFGWKMLDQAEKHLGHMHKLSNGMYMAEWLHLCAFSWGGLTKSPRKAAFRYRSSDIPENLIIGTSETNSVMTRFEKAWQALVIDESSLMIKGQENTSFNAKLFVTRNDRTKLVIRDEKKNGRYSRTSSPISLEESNIAKRHHFVAYTVSYSIHFSYGCKLLATGSGSSLKTIFYPFLRPFYHSVEDQLDKMLYEEIKARYNRDTVAPGVVPTSASGEIFDGTMVQSLSLYGGKDPYTSKNKTDASEKTIGTRPHNKAGEIRNRRGTTSYRDSGDFETWGKKWKTKSDDLSIPF